MASSIDTLLKGSRLIGHSSLDLWSGIRVERRLVDAVEREEDEIDSHYALLWCGEPTIAEREYRSGRFKRVVKRPGTLSLGTAGRLPAVRPRTPYDVMVAVVSTAAARTALEEIDERKDFRLHEQLGIRDNVLADLIRLLSAEANSSGESGILYRQSLEQAFIARFLFTARAEGTATATASPLPSRSLRRLLEKMESEYVRNLTLDELAKEVGYSRSHFQRMFRNSTGKSAFDYLRDIRLERARAALTDTDDDIAEIAAAVGFSSHAHLTKLFVRKYGVTPSRFRRDR